MIAPVYAGPGAQTAGPLCLPPDLAELRRARRWTAQVCRRWHAERLCDDAVLIVNELVSNAIRHAGTELLVELSGTETGVLITVTDQSTQPVRARAAAGRDEGGHGLLLVEALSSRWGVTAQPTGKRVWAELQPSA
jgi:anti-sigma regulatory factor (Ser/Thr protein kinase)